LKFLNRYLSRGDLTERAKRVVGAPFGKGLVPARWGVLLARLTGDDDRLMTRELPTAIEDPEIARMLAGRELGVWALSASSINRLVHHLRAHRPELVLEFSSGISTIVCAHVMRGLWPDATGPLVVALEQDADYRNAAVADVKRLGFADTAEIIHAPLVDGELLGWKTEMYAMPSDQVLHAIGGRKIEFILVDGPAAGHAARFATLPLVQPLLSGPTWFFLDDALRDSELEVARRWRQMNGIDLVGYDLRGKGLLVGRVSPSAALPDLAASIGRE
jgi:hypothetical protein